MDDDGSRGGRERRFQVVLYEPEIPQNTGNVARTCAATRTPLHLIEPLGFRMTDRYLKRAGLDYWPYVEVSVHDGYDTFDRLFPNDRKVFFSSHGPRSTFDFRFQPGDILVFGPETRGLPAQILEQVPERTLRVPIDGTRVRSLNLATTVGIVLYEALRQCGGGRRF